MPRVLVINEAGDVAWCERVQASDFQTEHFRRCLSDRLRWAVSDAENTARASLIPPLHPTRATGHPFSHALEPV